MGLSTITVWLSYSGGGEKNEINIHTISAGNSHVSKGDRYKLMQIFFFIFVHCSQETATQLIRVLAMDV